MQDLVCKRAGLVTRRIVSTSRVESKGEREGGEKEEVLGSGYL
jgi:hypothetical protein